MEDSLITVCIPVYNGGKFLNRVVSSCNLQENHWLNVLVVDNASNDDTHEVCKEIASSEDNFRFVRFDEHVDAITNWNRCIPLCETKYLCYVCCDDLVIPHGLKGVVDYLRGNEDLSFVCCSVLGVSPEGGLFRQNPSGVRKHIESRGKSELERHELVSAGVSVSGLIVKRAALIEVGSLSHEFELVTELILPQLLVQTSDFAVLENETGFFIPRRGSHYNREMSERVAVDLCNGLEALASRVPVVAQSTVIASSYAATILRNVADRGPISFRDSISILKRFRSFFGRTPFVLLIGLLGFSIFRFRGNRFDRITHVFRKKKYLSKSEIDESTLKFVERICPEVLQREV